jgi:hypothetical protein
MSPRTTATSRAVSDIRIGEFAVDRSLHTVSGAAGTVRLEPKVMPIG